VEVDHESTSAARNLEPEESVAWAEAAPGGAKEDPLFAPQACGIGEKLRVAYVIAPRAVVLRNLRPSSRYRVTYFDPVKGERTPQDPLTTDAKGEVHAAPPKTEQDWVCLLEVE
jgi:hypothetical protein